MSGRTYIAIDLKSFYASVECAERKLDPLTTNLVVADSSRTEKTICLAVSPSLKAYGIGGRARLFEVVQKTAGINRRRLSDAIQAGLIPRGGELTGSSFDAEMLAADPRLRLDYITAPPRMRKYMEYSVAIYDIYRRYVSAEDIHVYSIDECFIDVTDYLPVYHMTARELCMTMIREVLYTTGITATGGIGTNLYLCKVAMDIVAKHVPPDKDGVRIAELDELSYRQLLWTHTPITDFWRVGRGTAKKLADNGMETMGDVARCSIGKPSEYYNEALLYRLFGVNAELLIDHAWGWEPVTIAQIRQYIPKSSSLSSGQVLARPYTYEQAAIIVREMADGLSLDLVAKGLVTDQLVLTIGYDVENLFGDRAKKYRGPVVRDFYGRSVPQHGHGSVRLGRCTAGTKLIVEKALELYDRIADHSLLIRRIVIAADNTLPEAEAKKQLPAGEQMDLFTDYEALDAQRRRDEQAEQSERNLQQALLSIRGKFGKNAVLKGTSLQEDATAIERNGQIGGHRG